MTTRMTSLVSVLLVITLGSVLSLGQMVNVTTWHNDNWRTGQNANETTLTTGLVGQPMIFGRVCALYANGQIDGKMYAQPLIVTNVKFSGMFELELATGKRKLWKELVPSDAAGIDTIRGITITPDAKAYVYGYIRTLSDLYLVEGLK
jgi:hypothetical protein